MKEQDYFSIVNSLICEDNALGGYMNLLKEYSGKSSVMCCVPVNLKKPVKAETIKKNIRKKIYYCSKVKKRNDFLKGFNSAWDYIKASAKKDEVVFFHCKHWNQSFCIPVSYEGCVCGAVTVSNTTIDKTDKSSAKCLDIIKRSISDLIVREYELRNLKETIHPRAVALSTIHTVHRIISSTLEFKELLPKIARLCVQVVRANKCSIYMIDGNSGKYILPEVVIDLKNPEAKGRKIFIGTGNIGKVAKTAKAYKSDRCICVPLMNSSIIGVIVVRDKQGHRKFNVYDEEILTVLSEQASVAVKNAELYENQKKMVVESVRSLSSLLNIQIPSPYIHDIGFVDIIEAIGMETGLNQTEMNTLRYAAMLRNVARVGIPGEILLKPGGLTNSEYEFIKRRISEIVDLIKPLKVLKPAVPILVHHRERYDGKGYPSGLKGQDIPLGARIMALADAFEAMITYRPYKGEMNISEAVKEIKANKTIQFDPEIVDIFIKLYEDGIIENIVYSHRQQEKKIVCYNEPEKDSKKKET